MSTSKSRKERKEITTKDEMNKCWKNNNTNSFSQNLILHILTSRSDLKTTLLQRKFRS